MKYAIIAIISLCLFSSCTKEVNLRLDNKSGNIVIEGNITNQQGPYVVQITKSVAFSDSSIYSEVNNAFVTISDNTGTVDTLKYSSSGQYKTSKLLGTAGTTYNLKVLADGATYTAQSTMPAAVPLDSLSQDSISFGGTTTYTVLPQFTDPVILGNNYFFIVSTAGKQEKIFAVFSDNINNGVGNQRSIMLDFNNTDTDLKIVKGDSISVEMQCVDGNMYTYYSSVVQLSGGGPNAGITPSNPPSNISNGALGYFSAHTSATKTLVIQ